MEMIFMNTESSKTNEPHQFVFNLSQRLDLKSLGLAYCCSKFNYLLHVKKYKKTVQEQ